MPTSRKTVGGAFGRRLFAQAERIRNARDQARGLLERRFIAVAAKRLQHIEERDSRLYRDVLTALADAITKGETRFRVCVWAGLGWLPEADAQIERLRPHLARDGIIITISSDHLYEKQGDRIYLEGYVTAETA